MASGAVGFSSLHMGFMRDDGKSGGERRIHFLRDMETCSGLMLGVVNEMPGCG